jgi:hypothetical protein
MMAYNPELVEVHRKAVPDGDDCCEIVIRQSTEEERRAFADGGDWSFIDGIGEKTGD